ncbi:hypothetical protein [Janthinobacterium fluminis]|uniref:DUF1640 domain-containing protein n=1 Tax=Janthinobacterium fluminis TaxID=2987524 RepID=A0ABT5JYV4_9BURK|nr:hypothetical protein [Janthinobacterium fluminis]MDC8757226.1 hypothetical protein [Janthinobacterium fluminis]
MAKTFDSLAYARALESAGVPPVQAEIHASSLREALEPMASFSEQLHLLECRINTKNDAWEARLLQKMSEMEHSLRSDFKALERKFEVLERRFDELKHEFEMLKHEFKLLELGVKADFKELVAHFEAREIRIMAAVDSTKALMKWMMGAVIAMYIPILVKLFLP